MTIVLKLRFENAYHRPIAMIETFLDFWDTFKINKDFATTIKSDLTY